MLAKKCFLVGIFTLLSVSLAIADPPAVHPTTGEPLVIDCLRGTPDAIDGDLSDWNLGSMTPAVLDVAEQLNSGQASWDGPGDLSGEFYLLWDDVNIYVAVVVKDDTLSMNKTDGSIWNADAVEIFFSTLNAVAGHAEHYQYGINANNQSWNWDAMGGATGAVDYLQVASSITGDGYICEASIPHSEITPLDWSVGSIIGFHPVLDDTDNGDREIQMTWTSREAHDQSLGFGHMILSADSVPAPEPVNPGADGLVAHWPLDEGAGNTAADIVGGHDGTLKGGVAWAGEGSPVNGDALSFDGYSDGSNHATDPGTINWVSVDPFDVVGSGITLAAWIRPEGFDVGDARIITKQKTWSSSDIWWMLSTYTDGTALRMRLKTDDGGADNGTTTMFSDTGYLEVGVWSHVAATYDGSKMRLYHNAVEIMSADKTGNIQADPTAAVAIGNSPLGNPGGLRAPFHGLINDVRAYSRVLSEPEVRYLAGERAIPVDPGTDSLVAFYALDGDANDSSGNELHGTIVGDPAFVEGQVGMALELDGVDDYVDGGSPPELVITEAISIACWVNPAQLGGEQGFAGLDAGYYFKAHGEGVRFTTPGILDHSSTNLTLEAGVWQHVAATFQPGQDEGLVFYLNGDETERMTSSAINPGSGPFRIGNNQWNEFLTGLIDEVAIYGRILSAGEIRYLAGFRVNLALNPSFEEDEVILDDPDWFQWATWNPAEGAGSNATIVDTDSVDGARSLRIEPVGPENWHFIVLNLPILVDVDKNYTASFWAKADAPRPLTLQMKAEDNSVNAWGATTFDLTTEWAEYSYTSEVLIDIIKLEILCAGSEVPFLLDLVSVHEAE